MKNGNGELPAQSPDAEAAARVFISYSRHDRVIAERVLAELRQQALMPYLDLEDIAPGEPWQARLTDLIAAADAVLFLLSPDSITSRICDWEVNEAERLGKRVFPVVIRDVDADAVPSRLKRLNYSWLRAGDDWPSALAALQNGILTDIAWIREGSRLTGLAEYWSSEGRLDSDLLQGRALLHAEGWVAERPIQAPQPHQVLLDFLHRSREYRVEEEERRQAHVDRLAQFQSNTLARDALSFCGFGDRTSALLLALESIQDQLSLEFNPHEQRGVDALHDGLLGIRELYIRRYDRSPTPERIPNVAFFPPGNLIAICLGNECTIFDAKTGNPTVRFTPHTGAITACMFEANGRYLATAETGSIRLSDPATGEQHLTVTLPDVEITFLRINPANSDEILCGVPNDPVLLLVNLKTEQGTYFPTTQPEQMFDVVWSPDGEFFVTSCNNLHAEVWSVRSQKRLHEIDYSAGGWPMYVRFNRAGSHLICMSRNQVQLTNLADLETSVAIDSIEFFFHGLVSTPSEHLHVIKKNDVSAVLVDANFEVLHTLSGDGRMLTGAQLSPCGHLVCLEYLDQFALFDVDSGLPLANFHMLGTKAAALRNDFGGHAWFTGDSSQFVAVCDDGTLRAWRAKRDCNRIRLIGHSACVDSAAFHPHGRLLATAGDDASVRIWDIESGECVHKEEFPESDFTRIAAFSPDGRWLAVSADNSELVVIEMGNWRRVANFEKARAAAVVAAFDPGSQLLVVAGDTYWSCPSNAIRIFDVSDWAKAPRVLELPVGASKLLFAPSGKQLLTYGGDGIIRLIDIKSLEILLEQPTRGDVSVPLCWSKDFQGFYYIAKEAEAAPGDKLAHYDLATRQVTMLREIEINITDQISLVPNSNSMILRGTPSSGLVCFNSLLGVETALVSAGADEGNTWHVFDVAGGGDIVAVAFGRVVEVKETRLWQTVANYYFHESPIREVKFAPDGMSVVSCSSTGEVYIWRPQRSLNAAMDMAKQLLQQVLTVPERENYGLASTPPRWYVEQGKYPYDSKPWREWIAAVERGDTIEMPTTYFDQ